MYCARVCLSGGVSCAVLAGARATTTSQYNMFPSRLVTSVRDCSFSSTRACLNTVGASPSSSDSTAGSSSNTSGSAAARPPPRVDPSRLPRTIPGLSPEELATRIEKYQAELIAQETKMSSQQFEAETEMMRRSLSDEGFEEYLRQIEKVHAKVSKEAAKMAGMTPEEVYRYQQKQRRKIIRYEWYKTFMLLFVFVSSIFFLFFLFFFFT